MLKTIKTHLDRNLVKKEDDVFNDESVEEPLVI